MPTTKQVTDAIDAEIAAIVPAFTAKQEAYRAANGKYWQGLWTSDSIPQDGSTASPDKLTRKPVGVTGDWSSMDWDSKKRSYRVKCDEYVMPDGKCGWHATFQVVVNGTAYERVVQSGPLVERAKDWSVRTRIDD